MTAELTLYGAAGSGSVAIEAALHLLGQPYRVIEGATWELESARERVAQDNPMRQVPTLVYPDGEVMTESAAILLDLADRFPEAGLAPPLGSPQRRQYLRWMLYVSSQVYALYWVKADPTRVGAPRTLGRAVVDAVHQRIAHCWHEMDRQLRPGTYLLGEQLTMLDLYVNVISRFGPWRERFREVAPGLAEAVRRVDEHPRLRELWLQRFE